MYRHAARPSGPPWRNARRRQRRDAPHARSPVRLPFHALRRAHHHLRDCHWAMVKPFTGSRRKRRGLDEGASRLARHSRSHWPSMRHPLLPGPQPRQPLARPLGGDSWCASCGSISTNHARWRSNARTQKPGPPRPHPGPVPPRFASTLDSVSLLSPFILKKTIPSHRALVGVHSSSVRKAPSITATTTTQPYAPELNPSRIQAEPLNDDSGAPAGPAQNISGQAWYGARRSARRGRRP